MKPKKELKERLTMFNTEKTSKNIERTNNVFITLIEKPARKVLIRRGIKAEDYFTYCEEVGCDFWERLREMAHEPLSPSPDGLFHEPICMWLPQKYIIPNTSVYVQGIEVEINYADDIPEGDDIIELPKAKYLMFQGEPFKDENFGRAIQAIWGTIEKYNPKVLGYEWDIENPRIQLEPRGERGYIELVAVK